MSAHPIDWSKVPHTDLVSNSEDNTEVAEAKAGEDSALRRVEKSIAQRRNNKGTGRLRRSFYRGIGFCGVMGS